MSLTSMALVLLSDAECGAAKVILRDSPFVTLISTSKQLLSFCPCPGPGKLSSPQRHGIPFFPSALPSVGAWFVLLC
jgi:hypothetical protein